MNVSRVAVGAWLIAAALLLHSGTSPADATTAYACPSAHHAFYSYDHTSSAINARSQSTQLSRAAESSLAASEALFAFSTWRQRIKSRTYYVPDAPTKTALNKTAVDVYEPKTDAQDVCVYDGENAIAQVSAQDGLALDKGDCSAWFQPYEAASAPAYADVICGTDLNGVLACGDVNEQVCSCGDACDSKWTEGQSELLLVQSDASLFAGEQDAVDMDEIDKVLAVLDEDVIVDASPAVSSDSSRMLKLNDTEGGVGDANGDETHQEWQVPLDDLAYHADTSSTGLLPASGDSTASAEFGGVELSSPSSLDWIDVLEVMSLSALVSKVETTREPVQWQQESRALIERSAAKVDARVFVPKFSVRIEGSAPSAVVQRTPQLMQPFWATSTKPESGFLVGPPSLLSASSQSAPSREDRVERWKQKRKMRPVVAPRRVPDAALSTIRKSVAAKRQRVGGRFVSSGTSVPASFVPITALQK